MSKKKILFVLPSTKTGGAEIQTINQLNYLSGKDISKNFLLVFSSPNPDNVHLGSISSIKVTYLNSPETETLGIKSIRTSFFTALKVLEFVKREKIDVVVANLPIAHFILRLTKLLLCLQLKTVILVNYHRSQQYQASPLDTLPKKIFNSFNSLLARFTDSKSICISEATKTDLQKHFFLRNPFVLYDCVPFRKVDKELGLALIKSLDVKFRKLILVPGRIHASKGQLFFLNTFVEFIKSKEIKQGEYLALIAGGGTLENDCKTFIQENKLTGIVKITGKLQNEVILSLMQQADLIVIPSVNEGLGNIAIEALMQKGKILSSDAGGLKEVIHDRINGWTFRKSDQKDLVSRLIEYHDKGFAIKLNKQELFLDYQTRFSQENHMEKFRSIILE